MHYAIALGSNMRHRRHGSPAQVIDAAVAAIALKVVARSPTFPSKPVGPSKRIFANAALVVKTRLKPTDLLRHLKQLEARFGRRNRGQIWSARTLDCDIILWSGGMWTSPELTIPHPLFRQRDFVLHPLAAIARDWRDPVTGLSIRHLKARLDRRRPLA
jgi:2-amino-4-hydroxy-6-hydroxymethyldihydropteridine diphosphokinase